MYTSYPEEWAKENVAVITEKEMVKNFPYWCERIKEMAKDGKITLAIFDDSDMLFKHNFDISSEVRDLVTGHTHYGKLALAFITKRPQDIPARIYGVCEFIAAFSIESPEAIRKLNDIYDGFGDAVKDLKYKSYEFMLKEIGKAPVKHKKVAL